MRIYLATIFMLIALVNPINTAAQCGKCEHLEPVNGIFNDWDFSIEYDLTIREYLLSELPERYELRYIVKPSFDHEYVFQISREEKKEDLTAVLLMGENSIWYDVVSRKPYEQDVNLKDEKKGFDKENPPPISKKDFKIRRYESIISENDFEKIKELMDIIILQTEYYPSSDFIVTDGTTYFFTVWLDGFKSGKTWSPTEGSNMKKLVSIFEEMSKRTENKDRLKVNGVLKKQVFELRQIVIERSK